MTEDEKKLLQILAVFGTPVPPEAIFIDESVNYETLSKLNIYIHFCSSQHLKTRFLFRR